MKYFTKFIIIVILPTLGSLFIFMPIFLGGTQGSFFTFEPDVVYVTNAMSYNQSSTIRYIDHPGTPSIIFISKLISVVRRIVLLSNEDQFIDWVIQNQSLLYLGIRLAYTLVFWIAQVLFLAFIFKFTHSSLSTLFAWIALFSYRNFPQLGISIASETISFMILIFWFLAFGSFVKTRKVIYILVMSFFAGYSLANKFTNVAFFFIPIALIFSAFRLKKAVYACGISGAVGLFGLALGIWPIHNQYNSLISWALRLSTRAGMHGGGEYKPIDLSTHLNSIVNLWNTETFAILIILISLTAMFAIKKRLRFHGHRNKTIIISALILIAISLLFTKHNFSRYHQTNYIGLIFIFALAFNDFRSRVKTILIFLALIAAFFGLKEYARNISTSINETIALEKFIISHPPNSGTIWEYGHSNDSSLLVSQEWYGPKYGQRLRSFRPDIFNISSDFKYIKLTPTTQVPLFDYCWDQLYIQTVALPKFLETYPNIHFYSFEIPKTTSVPRTLLVSNHCQ